MKSISAILSRLLYIIIGTVSACSFILFQNFISGVGVAVAVAGTLIINFPILFQMPKGNLRLRLCYHGATCLFTFAFSCLCSVVFYIITAFYYIPNDWKHWLVSVLICTLVLSITFWNGIISVYCTSVQLGIRHRVVGILCGWIPVANLFALGTIIKTVFTEVKFESEKIKLNNSRKKDEICHTKYPLVMIHGIFFRDSKYLNYWGRIPDELTKNGAVIYYGNHQSALSIEESGKEIANRIKEIVEKTGCKKVNLIAHSKGGLDCRYALSQCNIKSYVASLTTINTPHRGCEFADYLLNKVPEKTKNTIANTYNSTLKRMGDENPDFIKAVTDLTAKNTNNLNNSLKEDNLQNEILCQSVGSRLNRAGNGKFPLNFTYHLVKYFDGGNDGLVSEKSFPWGENYTLLTVKGKRGISHGDMIDLNRENIDGFDVREFYVQLVAELKNKGL